MKDTPLASAIRKELKRLGISPKNTNVFDFQKFTKEELSRIFAKVIDDRESKRNKKANAAKKNRQNKSVAENYQNLEEKLNYIRKQYQAICNKIESLMSNSQMTNDYQDKLNGLMGERDRLSEEIDRVMRKQNTSIKENNRQHRILILKVEELLEIYKLL